MKAISDDDSLNTKCNIPFYSKFFSSKNIVDIFLRKQANSAPCGVYFRIGTKSVNHDMNDKCLYA